MNKVLLDTNAYTRLLCGNEDVLHVMGRAEKVFMSAIVLGELYAGFRGGNRYEKNRRQLEDFLGRPTVRILMATHETAEIFGAIKNRLLTAGTPIPINDVWIAAHATETGSHLITFDDHFQAIAGLLLWKH